MSKSRNLSPVIESPVQNSFLIGLLDSLPFAGFLALDKVGFVKLRVNSEGLKLVPREPLPGPLVVEEEDEVVGFGVTLGQTQHVLRRHRDGDSVVEVAGARHLGVDDEGGIPGVAPALSPHQVQRLQRDVCCRHAGVVLIPGVTLALFIRGLGEEFVVRISSWKSGLRN